jgi:hypothetical protein
VSGKVGHSKEMSVGRYGTAERCVEWEGRVQQRDVLSGKVGHSREMC